MDESQFIRERIRQAREDAGLSQRQIAKLLDTTQSSISDIERGKVQINAIQLNQFAKVLGKPIAYFYPPGPEVKTDRETKLLNLFRSAPEKWQERILNKVQTQIELYERVRPYERAGIPEEFYGFLVYEEEEMMKLSEAAAEGMPSEEEFAEGLEFYKRYLEWKGKRDQELKEKKDLQ